MNKGYKIKTKIFLVMEYIDLETGEVITKEEYKKSYTKIKDEEAQYKHIGNGYVRKFIRRTCIKHGEQLSIFDN